MRRIDATDEAVIAARPAEVFQAIVDLMAGRSEWWSPHLFVRAVAGAPVSGVGSSSRIVIPRRARFVARIEEAVAPSRLQVRYVEGDFRGVGTWTFDAEGEATRIRFQWQVVPQRLLFRLFAPIVERSHRRVMRLGFAALDAHLRATQGRRPFHSHGKIR